MFSNQKVFLDVKDYGRIGQLEADICQLGGTIEKFLSKEVTCLVTNRTDNALLHKDVSKPASTESQALRPCASSSRVMSRGQRILLRSNSFIDTGTPVCDPVAFAQTWGVKVVSLDTALQAIDKHIPTCNPSLPATNQPTESHPVTKRRKFLTPCTNVDKERHSRLFLTKFSGAFIKFEDTESNFRPFFKQYTTFPHIDLEGDLSNGIFKCGENIRPVPVSKNAATTVGTNKQKVHIKRGYCECCDVMYEDLDQHLISAEHMSFAKHADHFADLDKLIDDINLSAGNSLLLPAGNSCTCDVSSAAFTECTNCKNQSTAVLESASHNVHLHESQSCDCRSKFEESDNIVNAVRNSKESESLSVEQTDKCCRSPTHSVNSGINCDDAVENVHNVTNGQPLPCRCDVISIFSTSSAVSQSVYSCDAAEAVCNDKLDDTVVDENLSHSDEDMPEFISSDCVTNLLELISSENTLHSPPPAEEARHQVLAACENCVSGPPLQSLPTKYGSDTAITEVLPNENDRHTTLTNSTDECHFQVMSVPNDLHCRFSSAITIEEPFSSLHISTIKSEHVSSPLTVPVQLSFTAAPSTDATNFLESSLVTNNDRNYSDITSCNVKSEADSSALPLFEAQDDVFLLPVDQPHIYSAVSNNSALPVYACCQVNSSHLFDERAFSPAISSGLMADTFDLHDRLLTMAYEQDAEQQNCSSVQASYLYSANCAEVSTSEMSDLYSQMEFSDPLCFSESEFDDLSPMADSADAYPYSPIHSFGDYMKKPAISASDNVATNCTPSCCSSALCNCACSTSLSGSTDVNGNIQCSVPYAGLQTNTEASIVSGGEVDTCIGQESRNSCLNGTSETEVQPDRQSSTANKEQFDDAGLLDCDPIVLDLSVSACSTASFQSEANNKSSALKSKPCDICVQEDEPDVDNDSASTVVYSVDCTAEQVTNDESDTTVDYSEPSVSSTNTTWKVISFLDCRMKLVRTQAQSAESVKEVSSNSCVLQPESVEQTTMDRNSISVLVYGSTCPSSSANGRIKMKSDVTVEPSMSSTDSTWEVISFVDSRMRLVRS